MQHDINEKTKAQRFDDIYYVQLGLDLQVEIISKHLTQQLKLRKFAIWVSGSKSNNKNHPLQQNNQLQASVSVDEAR